jgi:hypothetical protein
MQLPTPVPLTFEYYPDEGIKHFGVVLFREAADGTGFGFGVATNADEAELVVALAEGLQEHFPELRKAWGQARPQCPGHSHPMTPVERGRAAWWACPADGRRIAPIGTLSAASIGGTANDHSS